LFIAILVPTLIYAAWFVKVVYFYQLDPATQAYFDEENPEKKMQLLEGMLSESPYNRWSWLPDAAELAFDLGHYEKAQAYARESLQLSESYVSDWNYGNVIHNSNALLGRLSLLNKDVPHARAYLLEAAKSKGSPQLDSFGPSFELANELLLLGERDVVLIYLASVASYWQMDNGCVKQWVHEINDNQTPQLQNYACE